MEKHRVSNKCSWVLQRKRGLTYFSEWMKMTYAVGLHESKLSHQGYPVQQCSVWFRNCSLADWRQDRGWLCPLGLVGGMLQRQTSPGGTMLPDSAPDRWSNTNAIRCRRHRRTRGHSHGLSLRIYSCQSSQVLLLAVSYLDKDSKKKSVCHA